MNKRIVRNICAVLLGFLILGAIIYADFLSEESKLRYFIAAILLSLINICIWRFLRYSLPIVIFVVITGSIIYGGYSHDAANFTEGFPPGLVVGVLGSSIFYFGWMKKYN